MRLYTLSPFLSSAISVRLIEDASDALYRPKYIITIIIIIIIIIIIMYI